jgi:signal peptidase II
LTKWKRPLFWTIAALGADLATKSLAGRYLSPWETFEVTGFFNLILTHNTGAAFSLFSGGGEGHGFIMAGIALVSVLPFLYFYWKARPADRLTLTALGLIWGGALGNIHDRLRWGKVVDFLDFHAFGRHWPAFNAADIAICAGALLLGLAMWRESP